MGAPPSTSPMGNWGAPVGGTPMACPLEAGTSSCGRRASYGRPSTQRPRAEPLPAGRHRLPISILSPRWVTAPCLPPPRAASPSQPRTRRARHVWHARHPCSTGSVTWLPVGSALLTGPSLLHGAGLMCNAHCLGASGSGDPVVLPCLAPLPRPLSRTGTWMTVWTELNAPPRRGAQRGAPDPPTGPPIVLGLGWHRPWHSSRLRATRGPHVWSHRAQDMSRCTRHDAVRPHNLHLLTHNTRDAFPPTAEQLRPTRDPSPLRTRGAQGSLARLGPKASQNPRRQMSPPGCGVSEAEPPVLGPQGTQRARGPTGHFTLSAASASGSVTHREGVSLTDTPQQDVPFLGPRCPCTSVRDDAPDSQGGEKQRVGQEGAPTSTAAFP